MASQAQIQLELVAAGQRLRAAQEEYQRALDSVVSSKALVERAQSIVQHLWNDLNTSMGLPSVEDLFG